MSLPRKFLFSLIPVAVLVAALEIACLVWERFDAAPMAMPRAAGVLPEKEEGEFRVLFYGGSTVEGMPEPVVGFVAQTQYYLEETVKDRKIRFFNFSGAGQPSTYVVRKMDQTAAGSEADAIVVLTAHNEFMSPDEISDEELRALYSIQESMYRSALVRRAQRLVYRYYTARRREVLEGDNLGRNDRKSARFKDRVALYERNLETIVRLAAESGVPLFLLTGPSNLIDWPPSGREFSFYAAEPDYESRVGEIEALLREGKAAESLALSREAARDYPDDGLINYAMAQAQLKLGEAAEARKLFYRARDLDPAPSRVLSEFNEMIREKRGRPGVHVIDVAAIFDERSKEGITGFEFIVDNCHPTPEGGYLIATSLIDGFVEAGLLSLEEPAEQLVSLDRFLATSGRKANWIKYRLDTARMAMKPPFRNFWAAEQNLKAALDLDPENWEVLANVATVLFFKGARAEGERYLREAVEKKGSGFDINDQEVTPYLNEAMEAAYGKER